MGIVVYRVHLKGLWGSGFRVWGPLKGLWGLCRASGLEGLLPPQCRIKGPL